MVLQLFAGRTTIRILVSKIDKVLLTKAPPCLNARGHRFGKRHGDAGFVTRKDFLALITPIGNRFEFVDAEDFLRLASDIGELRSTMDRATGWHYHTCEMQFVYILKGWVDLEFAGGRKEQFGVGDSVMIPGGLPHNEIATSDDLELVEVSVPAEMGTEPCEPA